MAVRSDIPQIRALCMATESLTGLKPKVHADFVGLTDLIERRLKEHVSESTLERLWRYSTRATDNVSLRTLDVISRLNGYAGWDDFCLALRKGEGRESDLFDIESIVAGDLKPGDSVRFGWLPDRLCVARYLGDARFEIVERHNSTLNTGDTFTCHSFRMGHTLILDDLRSEAAPALNGRSYAAGTVNGLTTLELFRVCE